MRKKILLAGIFGLLAAIAASPASAGLTIVADMTSDAGWVAANAASGGVLDADVNSAIATYEGLFTNNITVHIGFQWGGEGTTNGTGAAALPNVVEANLATTEGFFTAHAALHPENTAINTAVMHLPGSFTNPDPNGSSNFLIATAELAALTGTSTIGSDGNIGFGTSSTSQYWTAFALHEIGHILGRFDQAFAAPPNPPILTPLDFFKYDPNTTTLDPTFTITNFSIDGGATNPGGRQWSNTSDSGDWIGFPSDPYNYATDGTAVLSPADIILDNALGWDPAGGGASTPEPGTCVLLGTGLVGLLGWRRRKSLRGQA